jgi:hypothetical protein
MREEKIVAHWPADWPGRHFVDLDNVGDPGQWIDDQIPSVEEVLFGDPEEDQDMAAVFADAYISAGEELHFPLPTDSGMNGDDMRNAAIGEFIGFIREWRRRSLAQQQDCNHAQKDSMT